MIYATLIVAFAAVTSAFSGAPVSKIGASRAVASRVAPAQMFTVNLIMEDGSTSTIECGGDTYVLDQAEEDAIDQSDGSFLDDDQMGQGFCLTCVTYPTSDCTIA